MYLQRVYRLKLKNNTFERLIPDFKNQIKVQVEVEK